MPLDHSGASVGAAVAAGVVDSDAGVVVPPAPEQPEPPDDTPPVVTLVSPSPHAPLAGTSTPVVIDVTDATNELRSVLLTVRYDRRGEHEVVYSRGRFAPRYARSSRSSIAHGYRFTLRPPGLWPSPPTFEALAFDAAGNEAE